MSRTGCINPVYKQENIPTRDHNGNTRVITALEKGTYYYRDQGSGDKVHVVSLPSAAAVRSTKARFDSGSMPFGRSKKKKKAVEQAGSVQPSVAYTLSRDGGQTVYKVHALAPGKQTEGKRRYLLEEVKTTAMVHQWLNNQDNHQRAHKTPQSNSTLVAPVHETSYNTSHVKGKRAGTSANHVDGKHHHVTAHTQQSGKKAQTSSTHHNRQSTQGYGGATTSNTFEYTRMSKSTNPSQRPGSSHHQQARVVSSGTRTIERSPSVIRKEQIVTVHTQPRSGSTHVSKEKTREQHVTANGHHDDTEVKNIARQSRQSSTTRAYTATANNYGDQHSHSTRHVNGMAYANGGINTLTLLNHPPSRVTDQPRAPSRNSTRGSTIHYDVTDSAIEGQNVRSDPPDEKIYIRWSPSMRPKSQQDEMRNAELASQASTYVVASNALPLGSQLAANHYPMMNTLPSARSRTSRASRTLPCV